MDEAKGETIRISTSEAYNENMLIVKATMTYGFEIAVEKEPYESGVSRDFIDSHVETMLKEYIRKESVKL